MRRPDRPDHGWLRYGSRAASCSLVQTADCRLLDRGGCVAHGHVPRRDRLTAAAWIGTAGPAMSLLRACKRLMSALYGSRTGGPVAEW